MPLPPPPPLPHSNTGCLSELLSTCAPPPTHSDAGRLSELLCGPECRELASATHLLKCLPHALMSSCGRDVSGAAWLPELAVAQSMMLAIYPGGGPALVREGPWAT